LLTLISSSLFCSVRFSFFGLIIDGRESVRAGGANLNVYSNAFAYGGDIPLRYTCDGRNYFPPLSWDAGPTGTKSFVVMCVNPDVPSGEIVLWIVYNIPPEKTSLPERFIDPYHAFGDESATVQDGIKQVGYRGLWLPKNYPITQEYFFIVFALDTMLDGKDDKHITKRDVFEWIKGHELVSGILIGRYTKEPEVLPLFRG